MSSPPATIGKQIGQKLKAYAMPFQWRWVLDDSEFKVWEKSRRIGATYIEALRAVIKRMEGKRDYWFSSADETAAEEFIEYCRFWADFIGQAASIVDNRQILDPQGYTRYRLTFANGKRITALSSNPRNFRSKGGDVTWDEAAWHDHPREMWAALSMSATWAGQVSVLSTHNGEESVFNEIVREAADVLSGAKDPAVDDVIPWSYHRTTIVDAVEDGIVEKILGLDIPDAEKRAAWLRKQRARARDEDTWNQECMCIPSAESKTLLSYDLIESATMPAEELLGQYHGGHLYGGFDVGREQDLSVFSVFEDVSRTLFCRHLARFAKMPYRLQKQTVSDYWTAHKLRRFCGDATGLGDNLIEDLQTEISGGKRAVEKVKFTAEVKEDLAVNLLNRFQDHAIKIPRDRALREGLHKIRKTITASGNVRYDAARDADGHADEFWSVALANEAAGTGARVWAGPRSLPKKPAGW